MKAGTVSLLGRPNAGKSTLVNAILGEERMLTGPEAGITRDAIASDFAWRGRAIRLWDTAGIRRKAKVTGKIEKLAVADALRATFERDPNLYYEDGYQEMVRRGVHIATAAIGAVPWIEVDTLEDLERAREIVCNY